MSEDSVSDIPTGSSDDPIPIETPQAPTVIIKSKQDEADSSRTQPISEFEPPKKDGEQNIVQENKLMSTNFTVEIKN